MIAALIIIISIGIFVTILLVMNNNEKTFDKYEFDKYENEPNDVYLLRKHLNDERNIVERVIEVQNKFPNEKIIDTINAHYLLFRRLYNDIDRCGGVTTISYEYWWDVRYDDDKLYIYDNTNYFIYIIYFLIKKIVAFNNIPKPIKDFKCVQIYDETISIEYNTYHRFEEKKTIYTNGKYKSFYIYNPNL